MLSKMIHAEEKETYKWNRVFQMVMRIKKEYLNKIGKVSRYDLAEWVDELGVKEYIEFIEPLQLTHYNNMVLLRYGLAEMQPGFWENPDSIYRQCRSVVIDLENEDLVLTPFEKFFNLNEVAENSTENVTKLIKHANKFEVADKLDGSMVSIRYYRGKLIVSTSKSLDTEMSWRLADATRMVNENKNLISMIKDNEKYTFVFEYISLKDTHVVVYNAEQEGLYVIGMIDTLTGKEEDYDTLIKLTQKYNVLSTTKEQLTLEEMLKLMQEYKSNEKEGWVLNIDGHKVKIKCDDYVHIHRVIGSISSTNAIIESIADNKYDDLLSKVPKEYRERVTNTSRLIFEYIKQTHSRIDELYEVAPKDSKKSYMIWADDQPKELVGYLRNKYLGKEYNVLKGGNSRYKKMKELGYEDADTK